MNDTLCCWCDEPACGSIHYAGTDHRACRQHSTGSQSMTLKQWCELHRITATTTNAGAVFLTMPDPPADLWILRDYAVSTVSGPVVWLVRLKTARPVTML